MEGGIRVGGRIASSHSLTRHASGQVCRARSAKMSRLTSIPCRAHLIRRAAGREKMAQTRQKPVRVECVCVNRSRETRSSPRKERRALQKVFSWWIFSPHTQIDAYITRLTRDAASQPSTTLFRHCALSLLTLLHSVDSDGAGARTHMKSLFSIAAHRSPLLLPLQRDP